ncbi:MAG: hypothetical protein ABEI97_04155 [Candidatus Nanohaloarchaea archaeon]
MSAEQSLKGRLADYVSAEFYIDEHVLNRLEQQKLEIGGVLLRLRTGGYRHVEQNDSKTGPLKPYDSYKVFLTKGADYLYCAVIYLVPLDKPLIKTVYRDERSVQDRLEA